MIYFVGYLWKHNQTSNYLNQIPQKMQTILKSPRYRQTNPYKKVTVIPIDFNNNTVKPALIQTRSPKSNSKSKIKLVSPSKKIEQTIFITKTNQPNYNYERQKGSVSPKNGVQIELGGRNGSTNKENRLQSSQKKMINHQNLTHLLSSQHIIPKVNNSPLVQIKSHAPVHIQTQSRLSSPNKSVHINYIPTPFIVNRYPNPFVQTKPTVTFMHVRRGSAGMSIPHTKSNYPSELQIRQENVIEQLKESYEYDINDIKKLKEQIEQNNQQIKKLLKNSRASKETTKSKTLVEGPTPQKQSIHYPTSIDKSRSIKCHKDNNSCQYLQNQQKKDKAICSKKTLINALNFQSQQKIDRLTYESPVQSQKVQIQEISLNVMSQCSSKNSQKQTKLTLNNVCQVQCIAKSSDKMIGQTIALEDSIICQKQLVFKVQSNSYIQSPKHNTLKNSQIDQNDLIQLKNSSRKMIGSIKLLTKAVYQSDVKQKNQKIRQSKAEINKEEVNEHFENIMPVSQKSIKFQSHKSETSIPVAVELKKSEVKIPQMNFSIKQNIPIAAEPKIQLQPIKFQQVKAAQQNIETHPAVIAPKKSRKINNSLYL